MSELESELERRALTYTEWNLSVTKMEREGWHPITFSYANAGPQRIKEIKVVFLPHFLCTWCLMHRNTVTWWIHLLCDWFHENPSTFKLLEMFIYLGFLLIWKKVWENENLFTFYIKKNEFFIQIFITFHFPSKFLSQPNQKDFPPWGLRASKRDLMVFVA